MAEITKSGTPSLASMLPPYSVRMTALAGEDISAGDPCYMKSDGKIWRSTGTAANAAAEVDGWATKPQKTGEPITLVWDVFMRWGASLTPGVGYYLDETAGVLNTAATTGGTKVIAVAFDDTTIYVRRTR